MRLTSILVFTACVLFWQEILSQPYQDIHTVSIENDSDFSGYEILDISDKQLFVLGEHWHNIRNVPNSTLKLLKYLHQNANVRVLAIEHGTSVADMINGFLDTGDTTRLREITRNTMFWGKENWQFFEDLRAFNLSLPKSEQVVVRSIDVEYKMESAIFILNEMMEGKEIPSELNIGLGRIRQLFVDSKSHREQFQGLAVMYYYDKELVTDLVNYLLGDLKVREQAYSDFFGTDFSRFATMIQDMSSGLLFDFTNPTTNYKFRDNIIYWKFIELQKAFPDKGVLCVIGARHANKRSSMHTLGYAEESSYFDKLVKIRVSALYKKSIMSGDLKKIHFNYPNQLKENPATLIRHNPEDRSLRSKKGFDYTLFINELGNLTPFEKLLTEDY